MIHIHQLDGCAPTPLAHYLKALGILRLVAEQTDANARGWWDGDHFQLATRLASDQLESFFLYDYKPTPMFNPWGGCSGFYKGSSEKNARKVLSNIEDSTISRLLPFRRTIKIIRSIIDEITPTGKPSKKEKVKLIHALRLNVRGFSSLWIDTVIALICTDDDVSLKWPPIFGTGGNEGRLGYPSAYMSAVVEAVIESNWNYAIHSAIFGGNTPGCHWNQSMGQFIPNNKVTPSDSKVTPWDMLLAFEGACALRSSISGKQATNSQRWMSSPFYVASRSAGYASGSRLDEKYLKKGREYPGRGEQWLPVWGRPSNFNELQQIFLQGRAATKTGRVTDSWSMAKAVANFGVNRGIVEFLRYGYQQRNNQAAHFATPLGRLRVFNTRPTTLSCLDDLDRWLSSLHRESHPADDQQAKRVPARLTTTYRRLVDTLFAIIDDQATSRQWADVLVCLGNAEAVMRGGSGFAAQPVPPLRPKWVTASYDGTPEYRLAIAFALQSCTYRVGDRQAYDPVRRHWLPLEPKRPQVPMDPERKLRFATTGTDNSPRLELRPEVVMRGRRGCNDAVALVERRSVEALQRGDRHLPLEAAPHAASDITDLTALLSGSVDLDRTLTLARALMALDHEAWAEQCTPIESPRVLDWPDDAWLAIRLCALPWPLTTRSGFKLDIGSDPAMIRRLAAGDAATAIIIALRRLSAAGVRCTVRTGITSRDTARLWAAALAFPITKGTAHRFLDRLDPNKERYNDH